MGCRVSDFNVEGAWTRETIHGLKLEMAYATYKSDPGVKVTLYKVDGKFQGALHSRNFDAVRANVREQFDPAKLAEQAARAAEVQKATEIRNRMMWMHEEILEALTAAAEGLDDDANPTSAARAAALVQVRAILKKANQP